MILLIVGASEQLQSRAASHSVGWLGCRTSVFRPLLIEDDPVSGVVLLKHSAGPMKRSLLYSMASTVFLAQVSGLGISHSLSFIGFSTGINIGLAGVASWFSRRL